MTLLLRAVGLRKVHRRTGRGERVTALGGVDLEIPIASTVALVGPSGSGKSTLARCLALLEEPDAGEIHVDGRDLLALPRRERAAPRRQIQLLFQDPSAALNPRFSALEAVEEPLAQSPTTSAPPRAERRRRALELIAEVGLDPALADRRARSLSGGQRRRLTLARALAAEPRLLILDEGLAGLDLSLRAQIIHLLRELQARRGLSYLVITHDLRLAVHLGRRVLVLERGRIVDDAAPTELLVRPRHPASRALAAALGS